MDNLQFPCNVCPHINSEKAMILGRLRYVLLESETVAVRWWMGLVSLGYAAFLPFVDSHFEYSVSLQLMPSWMWSLLFVISGASLIQGVISRRYNLLGCALEGVLSSLTWVALGITTSISQGIPGATMVASLIALWILVRYPTWIDHTQVNLRRRKHE